jgi:dipeptidyl aminopeptidase/acylaminoacyl peptidase
MENKKGVLLCCCLLALVSPTAYPQKINAPLPVEELGRAATFGATLAISPDGQWVSYMVRNPDRLEAVISESDSFFVHNGTPWVGVAYDVWIVNTKTGESKNLTLGQGNNWGPSWSHDGKSLAFFSDRNGKPQLWLWERISGKARPVSGVVVHPFLAEDTPRWTADGEQILAKVLPEGMTVTQATLLTVPAKETVADEFGVKGSTVVLYQSLPGQKEGDSLNQKAGLSQLKIVANAFGNSLLADLALVDVSTGKVERIASGYRSCWYALSPDGTHLAVANWVSSDGVRNTFDLIVVSLADRQLRVVAKGIESITRFLFTVSWSPDGKLLSYTDLKDPGSGDCFLVSASAGEPRNLTNKPHPGFGNAFRPPLWDAAGESLYLVGGNAIWRVSTQTGSVTEVAKAPNKRLTEVMVRKEQGCYWSPDGRSMIVSTFDEGTKHTGFYRLDPNSGTATRLVEEDKVYRAPAELFINVSADGKSIVYLAQDLQHGDDVWLADADLKKPRQLTHIHSQLEGYEMGKARFLEWPSEGGQKLHGLVLLPSHYEEGKRYPLIVNISGFAPPSDAINRFGLGALGHWLENQQILATRGYAVLLPDIQLQVGTPMQDLAKTILPGVDKMIEMGIADPDRLGVMGGNYGGYCTLALITQTTRFKAAAMHGGFGDLFSAYGQMSEEGAAQQISQAEKGLWKMGGSPWEYRARYIENSPVFYLDRVATPLLITHGSSDTAVASYASDEVFVDLRRLGKEVVYAKYKNDYFIFARLANQLDLWNRRIDWFDRHLKSEVEKKPAADRR